MDSHHLSLGDNAYWVFISFLYASIATDIAKGFYKVICDDLERERQWRLGSHLVLASFVLGTSWITGCCARWKPPRRPRTVKKKPPKRAPARPRDSAPKAPGLSFLPLRDA
jgi:hypothetical protein